MPAWSDQPVFVSLEGTRARQAGDFPSPCVNVCRMSPRSGLCEGCWRTLDEIRRWGSMSDAAKQACWTALENRQTAAGINR
jgi:predicted Fe-S protein YdhL (DUF1289 family)